MRKLLWLLLLAGCDDVGGAVVPAVCAPQIDRLSPFEGPEAGGTAVRIEGRFLGADDETQDVRVRFGGADAEVTDLGRSGCDACEACATAALRCNSCDRVCSGLDAWTDPDTEETWPVEACVEWLDVTTPPGSGDAVVTVVASHGRADGPLFQYVP